MEDGIAMQIKNQWHGDLTAHFAKSHAHLEGGASNGLCRVQIPVFTATAIGAQSLSGTKPRQMGEVDFGDWGWRSMLPHKRVECQRC